LFCVTLWDMMDVSKRTKIVCTLGPASHTEEKLRELVRAGMNVCRLNFSHGTHEDHATLIKMIRSVAAETGEPLTILQDLQGPKIRVGELPAEGVELKKGEQIIFTTGEAHPPKTLPVTYQKLHEDVKVGHRILLDDGLLSVRVVKIEGQDITCEVVDGGHLTSHKGMNLPDSSVSISAMSDKDRDDVRFGIEQGVDWMALSFVRSAADIQELRTLIADSGIAIIAKIEKPEAVEHLDEIISTVDGIMVARGDLGVEIPAEKVPIVQKDLIAKCLRAAKPVIVATQMLNSMIVEPRPTRAEVSDIANAVIDHTDATMLSGETASGAHPIETVEVMAATIRETEASAYDDVRSGLIKSADEETAMSNVAAVLAQASHAKAIFVASMTGRAARLISSFRPELPIFAATPNTQVLHQLNISWGVRPFYLPLCNTIAELLTQGLSFLQEQGWITAGDHIVVVAGEPLGKKGHINLVEVRTI